MNPKIDLYLAEGCGRCSLGGTPQCKVHSWPEELRQLRRMVLECGLNEELKWSQPCYTYEKANVLLLSAFKDYVALSFFKGALLKDTEGILIQQTENVQATRQLRFTNVKHIMELEAVIKAYIFEVIDAERAGLKVAKKPHSEFKSVSELKQRLDGDIAFREAFLALTPGRQRGYKLYFAAPKQARTRESRIEKCVPDILKGKGLHER